VGRVHQEGGDFRVWEVRLGHGPGREQSRALGAAAGTVPGLDVEARKVKEYDWGMRKLLILAFALVAVSLTSSASIALNSSRSNIYRLVAPGNVVTPSQAAAVLKALDKIGAAVDEATLRRVLLQQGIDQKLIKKIEIIPAAQRNEKIPAILLLSDPGDKAAALAATCPGCDPFPQPSSKPKN
jgi:hypothetical protein